MTFVLYSQDKGITVLILIINKTQQIHLNHIVTPITHTDNH